jgi:hypothetical protein
MWYGIVEILVAWFTAVSLGTKLVPGKVDLPTFLGIAGTSYFVSRGIENFWEGRLALRANELAGPAVPLGPADDPVSVSLPINQQTDDPASVQSTTVHTPSDPSSPLT